MFLSVEQFLLGGQLNQAAGTYTLNVDVIDPNGNDRATNFGPNVNYTVLPPDLQGVRKSRSEGPPVPVGVPLWVSVVPDGVALVRWTFACPRGDPARCVDRTRLTVNVPVHNNIAEASIPHTDGELGRPPDLPAPSAVIWYGTNGRPVLRYGLYDRANLNVPPFVTGTQKHR